MKTTKQNQWPVLLVGVAMSLFTACQSDDAYWQEPIPQQSETVHTATLVFDGGIERFDGNATTRASTTWASGDKVYLQFTNSDEQRVKGVAVYNSSSDQWAMTYEGTLTSGEEAKCEAYYFENPTASNSVTIQLSPQSAPFADRNAKYIMEDGVVTVTAQLTPMTGRVRFKGTAGQTVNCAGMKSYESYSVTGNTFTQQVVNSALTIGDDGYTPYVYTMFFDATKRQLTVDADKSNYYRKSFGANVLAQGKSGYIDLPTKAEPKGWSLIPMCEDYTVGGVAFKMVRVLPGSFLMGSLDGNDNEKPVHQVTISKEYFIGETEVTQDLWYAVMNGKNPSTFKGGNFPVENVSYNDCKNFVTALNTLTGGSFRLPTEAEWEFAARGGLKSKGYTYSGSNTLSDVAWYTDNSSSKTHAVKTKQANELGIYDMSGNVWEWCSSKYRFFDKERNATLGKDGEMYCIRGGGWQLPKTSCRVSWRGKRLPDLKNSFGGFRLCLDAKYVKEKEETPEKETLIEQKE